MPYDDAIYSSNVLQIASDDDYSVQGDGYDGSDTKVAPALGVLQQGERPKRQRPAQHQNWVMQQVAAFLSALHDDGERVEDWAIEQFDDRRAEWVSRWARMRALNFPQRSEGASDGCTPRGAHFQPYATGGGRWYTFGNNERVNYSDDMGHTWAEETSVSTAASGETFTSMASKFFGGIRMLLATTKDDGTFLWFNGSGWSAATMDGGPTLQTGCPAQVVYDPIHDSWLWVSIMSDTSVLGAYSADPGSGFDTHFHAGTEFEDNLLLPRYGVREDTGRVIAAGFRQSDSKYIFVKTDDGGATWQDLTTVASTLEGDPDYDAQIVFNEHDESWIYTCNRVTGLSSQILRSTDNGATWTVMATWISTIIGKVACFEDLLMATAYDGTSYFSIYSTDNGANWYRTGYQLDTMIGVFAGMGRPLMLDESAAWIGLAADTPQLVSMG